MAEELTDEQRKKLEEKLRSMSPEEIAALQKQQCVFCQIVEGKIPTKKIYEDETCLIILDINPAAKGHLLLIPRQHHPIMPLISDKELSHLYLVAKFVSQSLLRELKASGTTIFAANGAAAGQRVPHFILHVIPRKDGDKILPSEEKMIDIGMIGNVKETIQNQLFQELGVKKKVVSVQKKLEAGPENEPEEIEEPPQGSEDEAEAEEAEKFRKPTARRPRSKKTRKSKEEDVEEPPQGSEDEEEAEAAGEFGTSPTRKVKKDKDDAVSLDDIADLFR
ncbi:hypothetical protein COV20_01975 [Candidatus Woesearchaeota archaeon CG10_big_fil_rev_8_21_14_0_10_45_16]|nr:MAG: hypothetical protein COV20_01975 [Candidatus Woesearchaeota archaeon CG10_big_fil_rev_8_21_14_0_10_45_16]